MTLKSHAVTRETTKTVTLTTLNANVKVRFFFFAANFSPLIRLLWLVCHSRFKIEYFVSVWSVSVHTRGQTKPNTNSIQRLGHVLMVRTLKLHDKINCAVNSFAMCAIFIG